MRKIRLSDTDLGLFDIEISPSDYNFYHKHKDAFRTMWKEQGTPFWTRFVITFRSFTVKHGVIKQMNIDTPKFQNLIDQAFIFIHEQFVDGNDKAAKNFIEDVARLAQHQDKLPALDSKSFAKDPFYARDTRELFRHFFGKPDQRSSYLKVFILCPVYLRFGGSVCRCLVRWVDAPILDNPNDDSYWTKPQDEVEISHGGYSDEGTMCEQCIDDSGTRFFKEKINGSPKGPVFLDFWTKGDPRFNDPENPLFAPHVNPDDDWREQLCIDRFRNFLQYAKLKYLPENEQCLECTFLREQRDKVIHVCKKNKKKRKRNKKKTDDFISDLKEFKDRLDDLEDCATKEEYDQRVLDIIEMSPNVMEVVEEVQKETKRQQADSGKHNSVKSNNAEPCHCDHHSNMSMFSDDTRITDEIQYSILTKEDDAESKSVVAGFKVIKIEDATNGLYEVNISAASIKNESEETHKQRMKTELQQNEMNVHILSASLLHEKRNCLPKKFEWWEGRGFCVAVLNYEMEEKQFVKKWTNFSLKVAGFKERFIKKIMLSLLNYIAKRKQRTCHGWNMDVDDVVACILTEEAEIIEDLCISIQRGFRFEDRLTDAERESLVKHQPHFCFTKILMGMEAGEASSLLTEKGGKDKLKNMCKVIAHLELYGGKYIDGLMEELRKTESNGKTKENMIWDFLIADPDKFEFFCIVDKEKESDLQKVGMKTVDIRYYMSRKNPTTPICPICKAVGPKCGCGYCNDVTPDAENVPDDSTTDKVNVLDDGTIQKGRKRENGNMGNGGKENGKKSKSVAKKSKDRKIELTSLPKKFQDVGIVADKALISIPTNEEIEPIMGKISINDKEERMAPIPGLSSSLNLILQNGGKEQTINVSLGAYMPEGKIHEIQDKKSQMKLHSIEALREVEKLMGDEKKEEKRGKKDKPGTCKHLNGHAHEAEDKTDGGLNAMFLREILGSDEASRVAKQWNTQHGISYKKQPLDGMTDYEKRKLAEKEVKVKEEKKTKEKETKSNEISENGDKENAVCKENKKKEKGQKQEMLNDKDDKQKSIKEKSENDSKKGKAINGTIQNGKDTDKSFGCENDSKKGKAINGTIQKGKDTDKSFGCENDSKKGKAINGTIQKGKDTDKSFGCENANNNNSSSNQKGKKAVSSKPTDDKLSHQLEMPSEGIPEKCSLLVIDHEKGEKLELTPSETLRIQEVIEKKLVENKSKGKKGKKSAEKNGKLSDEDTKVQSVDGALKVCWCCFKREPVRKAFKKCQKCKDEGVKEPRYYCSRECQLADWKSKHKQEHKDNTFPPLDKSS